MTLQLGKLNRYLSLLVLSLLTSAVASAGVTVTLASPANGGTVSSPATISAKASSGSPITGWHVYVDDQSVWHTGTTSSISANVSMTSGKHKIYVKAWDSSGAMGASSTIYVNVRGGCADSAERWIWHERRSAASVRS